MTLAFGPYPADGRPGGETTFFLDLTEEGELPSYADRLPEGARHVRMPIEDWGVPSDDQVARTLDLIDEALAAGETVYVHCRAGVGRTRTVIGCHRLRHGRPVEAWPETPAQRGFVERWPRGA